MENPFLSQEFLVRWSNMSADQVAPAITAVLSRAEAAIGAIAEQEESSVSFADTFLALERATEELTAAWAKVTHLQSVADSAELRAAYNQVLPRVSSFYAGIPLRAPLWRRLRAFAASPAASSLPDIHRRLLEETIKDFREAGADLPEEKRVRLEALQSELALVTQQYAENVLDATNAWEMIVAPEEESRLEGLPEHAKSAAARSAEARGRTGWRFTLQHPSLEPLLTYVQDERLRQAAWTASSQVGAVPPWDNAPLIRRILSLRSEKASLLGQEHFADSVLQRRMAQSGRRALEFVEDFQRRCQAGFARECRELEDFRASVTGQSSTRLAPWDVAYYAEKLRQSRYAFDEEELRPYFPIGGVIAGMFELAGRLFGLRIAGRGTGEVDVWHPDVRFYDVHDAAGRHLGSFYTDWHPREAKRAGAWMNYLVTGGPTRDGRRLPHLGLICGNLTPPNGEKPALLTHREVETIFHEFGHLLHHLLGEVEIKSLNGVNVAWDFVELPSQIMENWTWERESLDLFARHYQTGERIPAALFQKLIAARKYRAACNTMRQVAFAKLDLLIHMRSGDFLQDADIEPRARAAVAECLLPTHPPVPTIIKRFSHIFSDPVGYAAGYYSYKWAEVLEADAFSRFRREGIFNAVVGAEFVSKILSRGNSAPPASLFRDFMGRDPDPAALLERSGLLT
jgi:oligopeptidase A